MIEAIGGQRGACVEVVVFSRDGVWSDLQKQGAKGHGT